MRSGFSLIELSISIMILALLMVGIGYGSSLITQAKSRAVISEATNYFSAVNTFNVKYQAMPGDFARAFDVWGTACANNAADCNGNGNNKIESSETFKAWKHMQNANIIVGAFSVYTAAANQADIGKNVPGTSYASSGGWSFGTTSDYRQYIEVGMFASGGMPTNPIFKQTEAYSIDAKMDDGLPNTGDVLADGAYTATGCASSNTASGQYNTLQKSIACALKFVFFG